MKSRLFPALALAFASVAEANDPVAATAEANDESAEYRFLSVHGIPISRENVDVSDKEVASLEHVVNNLSPHLLQVFESVSTINIAPDDSIFNKSVAAFVTRNIRSREYCGKKGANKEIAKALFEQFYGLAPTRKNIKKINQEQERMYHQALGLGKEEAVRDSYAETIYGIFEENDALPTFNRSSLCIYFADLKETEITLKKSVFSYDMSAFSKTIAHEIGHIGLTNIIVREYNGRDLREDIHQEFRAFINSLYLSKEEEASEIIKQREPYPEIPFREQWVRVATENGFEAVPAVIQTEDKYWVWEDDKTRGPRKGFLNPYNATNWKEDVAEYVALAETDPSQFKPLLNPKSSTYDPRYRQKLDLLVQTETLLSQERYQEIVDDISES